MPPCPPRQRTPTHLLHSILPRSHCRRPLLREAAAEARQQSLGLRGSLKKISMRLRGATRRRLAANPAPVAAAGEPAADTAGGPGPSVPGPPPPAQEQEAMAEVAMVQQQVPQAAAPP